MTDNQKKSKTCAFITLGCKVNQYDTQALREKLLQAGYVEVQPDEPADIFIINTCTVTSTSDSKSRKYIRRAARSNPAARIIVTGCSVDSDPDLADKLTDSITPDRLHLLRNDEKMQILPLLLESIDKETDSAANTWSAGISKFEGHTRAFIKIQDGCNNFCSYCIVPYARGRVRSRPLQSIIEEGRRLADSGYSEIVLTGIHVGQYGAEANGGPELADVIEKLDGVDGISRIRLSSIEAMEVGDRLIELAAGSKLCPHLHLPLQSGSDDILQRMNRRYDSEKFLAVVERILQRIDRPSFTTDVLLGFPGESEKDFEQTVQVCRAAGFSRTHIFPFSSRAGTPAAKMTCKCSSKVVKARKEQLNKAAEELALAYKRQFAGERATVLVESENERDGKLCGYTERYVKAVFDGPESLKGRLAEVVLEEGDAHQMRARLAQK